MCSPHICTDGGNLFLCESQPCPESCKVTSVPSTVTLRFTDSTLPNTTFSTPDPEQGPSISFPGADPGLKNLTVHPITSDNVEQVLNGSLSYATMGSKLNSDDITVLSILVSNASRLEKIGSTVSRFKVCD
ncbi:hypothetical protein L596_029044 [Steinernema carpocapsae]|uniref:Uncharacterized protein n=1 Tax=Steinernema carpocapsae TaxID=34508 RepID=A0A4U5LTG4_STECR|nr:hypothetical protein L596_029044 [Steinernema carpocapsae]